MDEFKIRVDYPLGPYPEMLELFEEVSDVIESLRYPEEVMVENGLDSNGCYVMVTVIDATDAFTLLFNIQGSYSFR